MGSVSFEDLKKKMFEAYYGIKPSKTADLYGNCREFILPYDFTENKLVDEEIAKGLIEFAKNLRETRIVFGNGYLIKMDNVFRHPFDTVPAVYLGLCNPKDRLVGVLCFVLGFPIKILYLQGVKGASPKVFFKDTGKRFDEALIDSLIWLTNKSIQVRHKPVPKPKIVFSRDCLLDMKPAARLRLLKKYCPRKATSIRLYSPLTKPNPFRIRGNVFARLKRTLAKPI